MIEDHEAPVVPEARRRNEVVDCAEPGKRARREEDEAFRAEAAFVPLTKRSRKVVN